MLLRAVGVICVSLLAASCGLLARQAPEPLASELNTAIVPLARAALDVGQVETARRLYARLLEADPGSAVARMGLGDAALREGARSEAIRWYSEAIAYARSAPEARAATLAHARAALAVGDNEAAARSFGKLADDESEPLDAAWGHNGVGLTRLLNGDVAGAVTAMQEAVRLGPDELRFRENLGKALALRRQAERRGLLPDAGDDPGPAALDGSPATPAVPPDTVAEQSDMTRLLAAAGLEPVAEPDARAPQDAAPHVPLREDTPASPHVPGLAVAADVPGKADVAGEKAPPRTVDQPSSVGEMPAGDQPTPAARPLIVEELQAAPGVGVETRELSRPEVPDATASGVLAEAALERSTTVESQPAVAPDDEDVGTDDALNMGQHKAARELAAAEAAMATDAGVAAVEEASAVVEAALAEETAATSDAVDEWPEPLPAADPAVELSLEDAASDPRVAVEVEPDDEVGDVPMPGALATVPDLGSYVERAGRLAVERDDENGDSGENGEAPDDPVPAPVLPERVPVAGLPPISFEDAELPPISFEDTELPGADAAPSVWRGGTRYVEVGTYADVVTALDVVEELSMRNSERRAQIVAYSTTVGDTSFRVVDGPFVAREDTAAVVAALDDAGFEARVYDVEQQPSPPDLFVVRSAGADWLQAGAYGSVEKAMLVAAALGRIAELPVMVGEAVGDAGDTLYRTRIGPFDSRRELAIVAAILADGGLGPLDGQPSAGDDVVSAANAPLPSSALDDDGGVVSAWRGGTHYVEVGIYADGATAEEVADELGARHGRRAQVVTDSTSHEDSPFRVVDGPFETLADTEGVVADLYDAGFDPQVFGVADAPSPPHLFVVRNTGAFWLQAGAYGTREKAMLIASAIGSVADTRLRVGMIDAEDGGVLYRVRMGPFDSRQELDAVAAVLMDGSTAPMARD